jgi:hypothetical protein
MKVASNALQLPKKETAAIANGNAKSPEPLPHAQSPEQLQAQIRSGSS